MGENGGFKVEITSDFENFWRYNVAVTCGCFDAEGERVGFASVDDSIAPVGSSLTKRPADYPTKRVVSFDTVECHHLLAYLYVIPHTMPAGREVADEQPFSLDVCVTRRGVQVFKQRFSVNSWSGTSLELKIGE